MAARIIPALTVSAAAPLRAAGARITFQAAERHGTHIAPSVEGASAPAVYEAGTGLADIAGPARAHALASADFDEAGTPDLVGGYEAPSGAGVVTLQLGNPDALYPNSPEARARREQGRFHGAPFKEEAGAFSVPEAAQFIGAGDFDADGHADVAAGRLGGNALFLLRGDGRGNLGEPERVGLPGALTAFATGEVNRRDGLTDIVVGVVGDAGAAALRRVAEDEDLRRSEFNRAFVLMQYFGYLRRNPNDALEQALDYAGYDHWLTKLDSFGGDFRRAEMVKAFISSVEYRGRFGQP